MSRDICITGYFRPCIFFDTEEELGQFVRDAEETEERRERERYARECTLAMFPGTQEQRT